MLLGCKESLDLEAIKQPGLGSISCAVQWFGTGAIALAGQLRLMKCMLAVLKKRCRAER